MKSGLKLFTTVMLFVIVLSLSAKADLVGLWRFEEGAGTEVNDTSGYGNDGGLWAVDDANEGIDSNEPRWIASSQGGGQYALEFGTPDSGIPGSGNPDRNWNYVYVPYSSVLENLGTQWTIAFWYKQYTNDATINYGGGGGYQRVISCPAYEIELGIPGDLHDYFWPYYEGGATGALDIAIGDSQSLNVWHHMAVTYDGTTIKKYIDANPTPVFQTDKPDEPLPDLWIDGQYLRFGSQTYPIKDLFVGALDDIAIWNQCLSTSQISDVMGGDFSGPWEQAAYESDLPITYVYDPSFIARRDQIYLDFGEKRIGGTGVPSFNWQMQGTLDDPNYYGLVNAGLLDGDASTIEYAAYTTVGDNITQVCVWKPIHAGIKYDFRARFAGENAVNNVIGVKLYAVDVNDYNDATLLQTLSKTITANATWYDVNTVLTADANNFDRFKVVCYIEQGTGNPRGTAFAWFDKVRIDVNEILTCEALHNYGGAYAYDWVEDCRVNFKDLAYLAEDYGFGNNPEPAVSATELLTNSDFYTDIDRSPNAEDFDGGAPSGWELVPSTSDSNLAGVWNVSAKGQLNSIEVGTKQPAGGSMAAFIDPNYELRQAVNSPAIQLGQTYYLSAMLGGVESSYYHTMRVIYEYVDNPTSPSSVTEITRQEYVLPARTVWRRFYDVWTADSGAAGKYFRVRAEYVPPDPGIADPNGWGLVGSISIDTDKPDWWIRTNLITNGDFEDYSNLPLGTVGDQQGYINLFTEGGWTYFGAFLDPSSYYPPGWQFQSTPEYEGGLQCMLWAPSPQPAHGRISLWIGVGPVPPQRIVKIDQKVTSETIQNGQTYYLDYIGSISAAAFNDNTWDWPSTDPNLVVELYWLAPGTDDIYGAGQGTNWDLITSLKAPVEGSLGARYLGEWVTAQTSFTAGSSLSGKSFFVRVYSEGASYATFEEIYLSKEPPQDIGAYTCSEQISISGSMLTDLNDDCEIDILDVGLFVEDWVNCNDPAGCP